MAACASSPWSPGADPSVTLTNGTPLFSPPGTPDQLYFTFSDTLQQGTTTLWRNQASDGVLESTTLPKDLLLPFQATCMNSLSHPLSDGSDPLRWLFKDEHSKAANNAIMADTDRTQSREHRHGRTAICANGQQVSDFDETFVSNATIMAVGGMTNQNEVRLAQTLYGPYRSVGMREFMSLENGEFLMAAPNNTGRRPVYRVKIRPTVLRAGGETLRMK